MFTDLLVIFIFGLIAYMFIQLPKTVSFSRLDISLVVLLILAANMHGTFGFIGIGELRIYTSPILQGIFGGMLIKRLNPRVAKTA
jgi:hypothetical protein